MSDVTIKIPIPAGRESFFAERDFMVMPISDAEAQQLAAALNALAKVTSLNWQTVSTLKQVVETKGAQLNDVSKTLEMLMEPNSIAKDQIEFVRVLLGTSARVGRLSPDQGSEGRTLQ